MLNGVHSRNLLLETPVSERTPLFCSQYVGCPSHRPCEVFGRAPVMTQSPLRPCTPVTTPTFPARCPHRRPPRRFRAPRQRDGLPNSMTHTKADMSATVVGSLDSLSHVVSATYMRTMRTRGNYFPSFTCSLPHVYRPPRRNQWYQAQQISQGWRTGRGSIQELVSTSSVRVGTTF